MKYYTRTTHNFNNTTREWEFIKRFEFTELHLKSPLGIQALCSGRWSSLHEIISANRSYFEQWKDDPYSGVKEQDITEEVILEDLRQLEQAGLIKTKKV